MSAYAKMAFVKMTPHYRPDIDGLRAIAVLSVMLYHLHSAWLPGGFAGVDVFFVISGYVVTASLVNHQASSLGSFISGFYARRMARILPALTLTLVLSALLATLFIPQAWLSELSEQTVRYAFFGLSNWVLQNNTDVYFAPRAEFNPYTHTWSLGVEEQFYLIVPILLFYWARHQDHARAIIKNSALSILGLLCALSLAICYWASTNNPAMAFYFIGARFWELGFGAILFLQTQHARAPHPHSWRSTVDQSLPYLGIAGLALAFVATNPNAFPWPWAIVTVIATLCLIGGAHAPTNHGVRRLLANSLLVWVGQRSYSLYLWHWPIYVLLRWTTGLENAITQVIALVLTLIIASLSYQFVEQPLRQNRWLKNRANIVQIVFFALLTVGGFYAVNAMFSHASKISLSKVTNTPSDWYRTSLQIYPEVAPAACQIQSSVIDFHGGKIVHMVPTQCTIATNQQAIYVLGDSHAGMLAPALTQISAAQAKRVDIYTFPGCSYINFQAPMQGQFSKECLAFNEAARDQIANSAKAHDLVVLSSLRLMRYGDQWTYFNYPDMYDKMYGGDAQQKRQAALLDAYQWLIPFTQHQVYVLFAEPTPIFKAPTFRCSDWFNRSNPICVGQNEQSRQELERLRAPIVQAMAQLAKGNRDIYLWDPFPVLCPKATCTTYSKDRPLFFDGDHLSNYGNLVIYPSLSKTIEQIQKGAEAKSHSLTN
jgi:peptidoglycan/LPS O-acetylase OafA/YrhL